MENKIIPKQNMALFINNLIGTGEEVIGPKRKDGKYDFGKVSDASEILLDYDVTLLPPTQYLFPQKETLFRFKLDGKPIVEPVVESKPIILFAVHPYDIKAIELLDTAFSLTNPDINYLARREKTTIIGLDCLNPNPKAFCVGMGAATTDTGFDLMLTDIGDSYIAAIGSEKGKQLLQKCAQTTEATEAQLSQRETVRQEALTKYMVSLKISPQELPQLLEKSWDSPVWKELSEPCLSCGSCVMVCPTCFCFDVQDDIALNLKQGERYRQWDACLLADFAAVAGGGNFRKSKESRFRHRMYRKGKYVVERFDRLGCVGCGRCASTCLAEIASPAETFNMLKEEVK